MSILNICTVYKHIILPTTNYNIKIISECVTSIIFRRIDAYLRNILLFRELSIFKSIEYNRNPNHVIAHGHQTLTPGFCAVSAYYTNRRH